jgi:hypothetical protein
VKTSENVASLLEGSSCVRVVTAPAQANTVSFACEGSHVGFYRYYIKISEDRGGISRKIIDTSAYELGVSIHYVILW